MYNAVDDTRMAGSNGSPIMEYPEDRLGQLRTPMGVCSMCMPQPSIGILCRQLGRMSLYVYIYNRMVIEQLADEAYRFGQQTEVHECRLLDGEQDMSTNIIVWAPNPTRPATI